MFSAPHVLDLLVHEFTCRGGRALAAAEVRPGLVHCFPAWHRGNHWPDMDGGKGRRSLPAWGLGPSSRSDCRKEDAMRSGLVFLGGMGAGAGLLFLLDPSSGRRRRAQLRGEL